MNLQPLKAGDVCLIVGANYCVENIGKTCVLVEFVKDGERFCFPDGEPALLHCPRASGMWIVTGRDLVNTYFDPKIMARVKRTHPFTVCTEINLIKINGHKEPEANKEKLTDKV